MNLILKKNEAEINENVAKCLLVVLGFVVILTVLCATHVFNIRMDMIYSLLLIAIITLFFPAILVLVFHCYSEKIKYLVVTAAAVMVGSTYVLFTFQAVIIFILPTLLAALYLNKRVIYFSGIVTTIAIFSSHILTGLYLFQPDLEPFSDMIDIIRYGASSRILQYWLCFYIIVFMVNRYRKLVDMLPAMNQSVANNQNSKIQINQISQSEAEQKELEQKELEQKKIKQKELGQKEPEQKKLEQKDLARLEYQEALSKLAEREQDVFKLMVSGYTNMQIANTLYLSNGTVKNYVSIIYDKLETRQRNELIMKYSVFATSYESD